MTILTYIIFYILAGLNIISGIKKKRSNALYVVALFVVFVLMTFNYRGPDIGAYIKTYNSVGNAHNVKSAHESTYMEYGYTFLMFCANRIGLDFFAFRIILTFVCLSFFVSTVRYYKVNPNFIIGLYMVYLFFFDTIQIRNCISQFIILFATRYLFSKTKLSIVKYIACVAIASSIHVLALVYLSLLLVRLTRSRSFYQCVCVLAAALFVVCVLIRPLLPQILSYISKLLNRGESYLHSELRFSYLAVMGLHVVGLLPLYVYGRNICDTQARRRINTILYIEIIMGVFLPFAFINSNFNRIFRNILILDTIGLTLLYENTKSRTRANVYALAAQLSVVGGWFVTDMFRNRNEDIVNAIMKYNLIFDNIMVGNIWQYIFVAVLCLCVIFAVRCVVPSPTKHYKRVVQCRQ